MGLRQDLRSEWLSHWMGLKTRGEIKRSGKVIDGDSVQREFLVTHLMQTGCQMEENDSGKTLLRRLLNREEGAQVRQNPIHINEVFECIFCKAQIAKPTKGIRDHCPVCLRGRHVDIVPGDRAASCKGQLNPTRLHLEGGITWISYSCIRCEHTYRVRAHSEDQIPLSLSINDLPKRVNR